MTYLPTRPGIPTKHFRSWGETQIARMLDRYSIPYLYEHPLAVLDEGKTKIWYPDYQLCGYGVLIEYCGLPERPDYAAGMARKSAVYRENGLTALMITPDQLRGDWPGRILGEIEGILNERVAAFRGYRRGGVISSPRRDLR